MESNGPTLVLVHGLGLTSQIWAPIISAVSPACTTLAVDVPGFGSSPRGDSSLTLATAGERIAQLIESLGHERIVIVGHSMGGFIALDVAQRLRDKIEHIILLDSTLWRAYELLQRPIAQMAKSPVLTLCLTSAVLGGLLPIMPMLLNPVALTSVGRSVALWPFVHRPTELDSDIAYAILADIRRRQPFVDIRRAAKCFDLQHLLNYTCADVTTIRGSRDRLIDRTDVEYYREHCSSLQHEYVIPGSGHWPMVEATQELGDILWRILH